MTLLVQYIDEILLNDEFVPFTSMDLSYLERCVTHLHSQEYSDVVVMVCCAHNSL